MFFTTEVISVTQPQLYSMNIELTNKCPLRCPQCYCSLTGDKHIALETAKEKIKEAAEHGVETINLSGGETLCYPWLYDLISYASKLCKNVNIAISGCFFDEDVLAQLLKSGVTSISVSLNGSTEEINRLTRNGYTQAINALKILGGAKTANTFINWVMHSSNCEDFPKIVMIAEKYGIPNIDVIMFKPDSQHELKSYPSGQQMKQLADFIRHYIGPVKILVETCFSQMIALIYNNSWHGNIDTGMQKGCRAGLYLYNITVDGKYSPCRHLDSDEQYGCLDEYLSNSPVIQGLRDYEKNICEPCNSCIVHPYCRPCPAISDKIHGEFFKGQKSCQIWQYVR